MSSLARTPRWDAVQLPREWLIQAALDRLGTARHLLVTGLRRSGKSWLLEQMERHPNRALVAAGTVIRHTCAGENDRSTDPIDSFLVRAEGELERMLGAQGFPSEHTQASGLAGSHRWNTHILPKLRMAMGKAENAQARVYILIDGLDQDRWRTERRLLHFIRDELSDLPAGVHLVLACKSADQAGISQLVAELDLAQLDLSDTEFASNWRDDLLAYAESARKLQIGVRSIDAPDLLARVTPDFTTLQAYLLREAAPDTRPPDSYDWRLEQDVTSCLSTIEDDKRREMARRALVLASVLAGPLRLDTARLMLKCDSAEFGGLLRDVESFISSAGNEFRLRDDHYASEILRSNGAATTGHAIISNYAASIAHDKTAIVSEPYIMSKSLYHIAEVRDWHGDAERRLERVRVAISAVLLYADPAHPPHLLASAAESYVQAVFARPPWRADAARLVLRLLGSRSRAVQDRLAAVLPRIIAHADLQTQAVLLRRLRRSRLDSAVSLYSRTIPDICDAGLQRRELWWAATRGRARQRTLIATHLGRDWPRTDAAEGRAGSALLNASHGRLRIRTPLSTMRFGAFAADLTIGSWIASPLDKTEIRASSVFWESVLIDELRLPEREKITATALIRFFGRRIGSRTATTLAAVGLRIGKAPETERQLTERLLGASRSLSMDLEETVPLLREAGAWSSFVWSCSIASLAYRSADAYIEGLALMLPQDAVSLDAVTFTLASALAIPEDVQEAALPTLEQLLSKYWATASESEVSAIRGVSPSVVVAVAAARSGGTSPALAVALSGALGERAAGEALDSLAAVAALYPHEAAGLLQRLDENPGGGLAARVFGMSTPTRGEQLRDVSRHAVAACLALSYFPRLGDTLFVPGVRLALEAPTIGSWARQMPLAFINETVREGYHIGRLFGYAGTS